MVCLPIVCIFLGLAELAEAPNLAKIHVSLGAPCSWL